MAGPVKSSEFFELGEEVVITGDRPSFGEIGTVWGFPGPQTVSVLVTDQKTGDKRFLEARMGTVARLGTEYGGWYAHIANDLTKNRLFNDYKSKKSRDIADKVDKEFAGEDISTKQSAYNLLMGSVMEELDE